MTASDLDRPQTYQQEEAQQILQLAFARQTEEGEVSRSQLLEIASELGISADCLQAAEQDWQQQQSLAQQHLAFDTARRQQLHHRIGRYSIFNIFLVSWDSLMGGNVSWSLYILLLCALFVALDAWKVYQLKGDAYEEAFQNWQRKRQIKQSLGVLWDSAQKFWQA